MVEIGRVQVVRTRRQGRRARGRRVRRRRPNGTRVQDHVQRLAPAEGDRVRRVVHVVTGLVANNMYYTTNSITLGGGDRKSTRLNSSHVSISDAVFCLKKKN